MVLWETGLERFVCNEAEKHVSKGRVRQGKFHVRASVQQLQHAVGICV